MRFTFGVDAEEASTGAWSRAPCRLRARPPCRRARSPRRHAELGIRAAHLWEVPGTLRCACCSSGLSPDSRVFGRGRAAASAQLRSRPVGDDRHLHVGVRRLRRQPDGPVHHTWLSRASATPTLSAHAPRRGRAHESLRRDTCPWTPRGVFGAANLARLRPVDESSARLVARIGLDVPSRRRDAGGRCRGRSTPAHHAPPLADPAGFLEDVFGAPRRVEKRIADALRACAAARGCRRRSAGSGPSHRREAPAVAWGP